MATSVRRADLAEIASLREAFRREMNCQIVHDAIHARPGWSDEYLIAEGDGPVGYASIAVGGPWRGRPTVYEVYLVPEERVRAFTLFETFLDVSRPEAFEVQTNDTLSTMMCLTFARDIGTERVVFRDDRTTELPSNGVTLRRVTPVEEIETAIADRQGGGEWVAEMDGAAVGSGGILFHYNRPYGDLYMDVNGPFRRRGIGSYLVQELKRICYDLGSVPCARCTPSNGLSRRTLQKAGLVPFAHILFGALERAPSAPE